MFENLLSTSTQKQVLGVSLTPGIGLEAVIYDRNKNAVLKYGRRKVEYNFSTRDIENYVEFKAALGDLVSELGITENALAYMVLPNVYFDFAEIPQEVNDTEIPTILLSKAEDFYLFKKESPVSGWCNVANINDPSQRKVAYTSFQQSSIDNIKEAFADVKLQLVGVESGHTATIRGLHSIGKLDALLAQRASWIAMIVNTNSFTLLAFNADNLESCVDVPIAIKSFSTEEAYAAIASSASERLDNFSSSKLFIISQTDDISASVLKNQMQYEKEIETINCNKYSDKPVVEVLASSGDFKNTNSMTLASIGASNVNSELGLSINVLAENSAQYMGVYFTTSVFGTLVDVTGELVKNLCIFIVIACVLVFGLLIGGFSVGAKTFEDKSSEMQSQIDNIRAQIEKESQVEEKKEEIDMTDIIDDIATTNVKTIKFYDSIASDMPKNIWLTKYYNKQGDLVAIQGVAEKITDIYEYFKNLKIVSPESDIKLNELKAIAPNNAILQGLVVDENKDRLYSFEISSPSLNIDEYTKYRDEKKKASQNNNGDHVDETEIIVKPSGGNNKNVEQMGEQVKPAQ